MTLVDVYTRDYCGYCTRATHLLRQKGIAFTEHNASKDPKMRDEMIKRSGRRFSSVAITSAARTNFWPLSDQANSQPHWMELYDVRRGPLLPQAARRAARATTHRQRHPFGTPAVAARMIHYSLQCGRGHGFDGWFGSSGAFDKQCDRGLLHCPVCGTADVSRALMAPAVVTKQVAQRDPQPDAEKAPVAPGAPAKTSRPAESNGAIDPTHAAVAGADKETLVKAMRALRQAVLEHGTNVGTAFPEEARRIHYGEAEARGIYGSADADEVRALVDEGINILPIPTLPEDRN